MPIPEHGRSLLEVGEVERPLLESGVENEQADQADREQKENEDHERSSAGPDRPAWHDP